MTRIKKPENTKEAKAPIKISQLAKARAKMKRAVVEDQPVFSRYIPMKGVVPADLESNALAMDSTDYLSLNNFNSSYYGRVNFQGYQALAGYAQLPEYRKISETIAKEMTRKFIKLTSASAEDNAEKMAALDEAIKKFKVRDRFCEVAQLDCFFGRGNIFVDLKTVSGKNAKDAEGELATPIAMTANKIAKGSLVGLSVVEPMWTYPSRYNSTSPLRPNFYTPKAWYVAGDEVHSSRLLGFVSRPVPDILKPSYNFGGVSLTQLVKPYVENFLRVRDSVSALVHSFSLSGIKTDLSSTLSGGDGADMADRAEIYNAYRDNNNLMLLDFGSEEFFQVNTPLTGLNLLQAQAQEQIASVASIPLVKLLGISPSGLNASTDGEIRVFYDYIKSLQEHLFRGNLKTVLDIIQLSEFGEIDDSIDFEFVCLYEIDEVQKAAIRKTNVEIDAALVGIGAISQMEVRERLAGDHDSGYSNIDTSIEIEPQGEEAEELPSKT